MNRTELSRAGELALDKYAMVFRPTANSSCRGLS